MPQWDTTQPTSISQRTPTISISEAKDFVEKMKAIGKQTSSLGETEKILTNLELDWKKAMNDFSQTGIEFVTAPILFNPVAKLNGDTKVLVYKDSLNQLTACFMTYVPDSDYYKDNKGKMSPLTFTGTIIYTNLQGKPFLSLKIKNGKFQKYLSLTIERGAGNALGSRGVSECISMTMECQFVLQGCTSTVNFCDCTCDCGWTWQTNTAGSTGVPGVSGGCGEYDTGGLGAGSGSGGGGVGGGSGGGTASSWGSSQPTNVITDINRYVFLLQEEGFDLSKLPKLDEVAAEIYYNSWTKYRDVGFNPAEFTTLSADANLFAQVDGLREKLIIVGVSNQDFKLLITDRSLRASIEPVLNIVGQFNSSQIDLIKELISSFKNEPPTVNEVENENRDVRLDLNNLLSNNDYQGFTVLSARNSVSNMNPTLETWKVNISAGKALENAFADFAGYNRGWNFMASVSNNSTLGMGLKIVRPDFVHATSYTEKDAQGRDKTLVFYAGGIIEVKCPQNAVTLETSKNQIEGEINIARYARSDEGLFGETVASQKTAGSFTLVVPWGTNIDPAVIQHCNDVKVNMYVSYAFVNRFDNAVVFSNPKKMTSNSQEFSYIRGNLDRRVRLDIGKAIQQWDKCNDDSND